MDSSLRTIALANRSGQIEGPIFAQQKGNKLTLRAGQEDRSMPLGRYSDDDTSPPSPGRPSASPAGLPFRRVPPLPPCSSCASSASPPPLLRPFCFPFPKSANRQRPRGSVSRLIKRRKLANEISIRLRNMLVGVVSFPPLSSSSLSLPLPFFLSVDRLISWIPVSSSFVVYL